MAYIIPCRENWDHTIPISAGNLKLAFAEWATQNVVKSHFVAIKFDSPGMEQFPLQRSILKDEYSKAIRQLRQNEQFERSLNLEVASCIHAMCQVNRYMDTTKPNEAAVRMLAGNEIIIMLCAIHDMTFKVEDKMLAPIENEVQSLETEEACAQMVDSITPRSTTDYICYTTYEGLQLATVLLETKSVFHPNALAQLIGYYIRACANALRPGICVLLTAETMHIVIFPFCSKQNNLLVNAVCLKPLEYRENLELHLKLLAIVTHSLFCPQVILENYSPVSKGYCFNVETALSVRLRELEKELKRMKEAYLKVEKEVLKLRCQIIPMSVDI